MDVSVPGTIDQKTYLKKFRGGFSPLSPPLDPPMEMPSNLKDKTDLLTGCIMHGSRHCEWNFCNSESKKR